MAGKFMKIKRLVIPFISLVILTSQLTGCAMMNQADIETELANGTEIELEIAEPEHQSNELEIGGGKYIIDTAYSYSDDVEEDTEIGVIEDIGLLDEDEPIIDEVSTESEEPAEEVTEEPIEEPVQEIDLFTDTNETVYATGTVNLRSGPGTSFEKVGQLKWGQQVTRTGIGTAEAEGWSEVQLSDGSTVYVSNSYLSLTKPVASSNNTSNSSNSGTGGSVTPTPNGGGGSTTTPSQNSTPSGGVNIFAPGGSHYTPDPTPGIKENTYIEGQGWTGGLATPDPDTGNNPENIPSLFGGN